MNVRLPILAATLLVAFSTLASSLGQHGVPEFTHPDTDDWINSAPLSLKQLRGKPTLIEFWTFDCSNCLQSIAWMKAMSQRKGVGGINIVTVHSPELSNEKDPNNVRAAVRKLGIEYPVMLDRDFSYWRAMDNQYWPAFYLLDKDGNLRAHIIGELHVGEPRAVQFEKTIDALLTHDRFGLRNISRLVL